MNDLAARYQGYLVAQLAFALIAVAMLLFGDFGGFYFNAGGNEVWGTYRLGSGLVPSIMIIAGIVGLTVAAQSAGTALRDDDVTEADLEAGATRAILGAGAAMALALVGAGMLIIGNLDSDWWLDVGFYGGAAGGGLVALLAWLLREQVRGE